jgi:hypothetical protein
MYKIKCDNCGCYMERKYIFRTGLRYYCRDADLCEINKKKNKQNIKRE